MVKGNGNTTQHRGAAALWSESESIFGQKPQLRLHDIVEAAVEIADERGLDAVSMSNVAKRLGFSTMALYRHVANKGELLEMMYDVGLGLPPSRVDETESWRDGMYRLTSHSSATLQERPWLLEVQLSGVTVSPNNTAWLESGLQALAPTGLSTTERLHVYITVMSFLLGIERHRYETRKLIQSAEEEGRSSETFSDYGASLAKMLPPGRFPEVENALSSGIFMDGDDEDIDIQMGLEIILAGVEAMIHRKH